MRGGTKPASDRYEINDIVKVSVKAEGNDVFDGIILKVEENSPCETGGHGRLIYYVEYYKKSADENSESALGSVAELSTEDDGFDRLEYSAVVAATIAPRAILLQLTG